MGAISEMNELEERKTLLLAQSELRRRMLQVQYEALESRVEWVDKGFRAFQSARPFLVFGAPLFGYLVARKWSLLRKLSTTGLVGWRLARGGLRVLRKIVRL